MEPCSREMHHHLLSDHHDDSQIQNAASSFDPPPPPPQQQQHDDFFETMLSSIPSCSSWPGVDSAAMMQMPRPIVDESSQSENAFHNFSSGAKMMMQQQQIMMMPLSLGSGGGDRHQNDVVEGSSSSFKSPSSHQRVFIDNGFGAGSLHGGAGQPPNQPQHFHHPQGAQNFGAGGGAVMNQGQAQTAKAQPQGSASTSGAAPQQQPKPRVRARRGQATDPHSIAERLRRERIAERMKALQELVPNANKTDKASMLDEIIDYVKFLQLQVKVLSMSRLGGAAAVAPLVADMASEGGGGDSLKPGAKGGSLTRTSNGNPSASSNDNSLTVTEHQVAKLMEEDMGSAMQYLQGKGLCLMPISLATAISTATSHSRNPLFNVRPNPTNNATTNNNNNHAGAMLQSNNGGEGPSSPNMSVLTVQSATAGNGAADAKDNASVSK